jgi:hypothetical protein
MTAEPDASLALVAEHQELFEPRRRLLFAAKFMMEQERG